MRIFSNAVQNKKKEMKQVRVSKNEFQTHFELFFESAAEQRQYEVEGNPTTVCSGEYTVSSNIAADAHSASLKYIAAQKKAGNWVYDSIPA